MRTGRIWWRQLGSSLRFLDRVANVLEDSRSAVLEVPSCFPWRMDFYESVELKRSSYSGQRYLKRLVWQRGRDPGMFILEELCPFEVRANYWPGKTYAEYLASIEDLMLNDCDVWVSGLHEQAELCKWDEIISQYSRCTGDSARHAAFILEYDGMPPKAVNTETIRYNVEDYHCRVFCLETAAELNNSVLHTYQAELALSIGGNDPELCAALLETGERLLREPVHTSMEITETCSRSDGTAFRTPEENQICSAVWRAAIVLIFPILEKYRMSFIEKHQTQLLGLLPIFNSNGDKIDDPQELELGSLFYLTSQPNVTVSKSELETLRSFRKIRNLLAHNKMVPYDDLFRVLGGENR